jgi:hypothetical protein
MEVERLLLDLHLGRPVTRGGLSIFPVFNGAAVGARGYDLHSAALTVREHSSPVVEELVVENTGVRPALVLEGELLEGGHQHRVATQTVLVGAGQAHALPVRCVEQSRWSGAHRQVRAGRRAPVRVRAALDQGDAWQSVQQFEARHASSPTHSLVEASRVAEQQAGAAVADLRPLPFQTGVLIGVAGHPMLLEVFDSPRTLAHAWKALLRSAALDAAGAAPVPTPGRRARRFLDRLDLVPLTSSPAGVGTALRGSSQHARLDVLVWRGRPVAVAAVNARHELAAA